VDRSAEQYRYLVELVRKALAGETQQALMAAGGTPRFTASDPQMAAARTVSDLIDRYSEARSEAHGEESTRRKRSLGFRALSEVAGPRSPANAVTEQHAQAVSQLLARTPSNSVKKLGKTPLREAAAIAAETGRPLLAPATIAGQIQGLRAMFSWAEEQGDWGISRNPFQRVRSSRAPQVRRRAFLSKELQVLFDALATFREKRPSRFWVPALALYTGARMNEVCQLYTLDVIDVEGVNCLNLSEFGADGRRMPDKRVKTGTSERIVPLHSALIDAGFLDFVATRRGADRLFPDLKLGPDGRYSHGYSKWFGPFKRKCGFEEPSLVFHSFRHGFRNVCRQAEIGDEAAHALGGWTHINQASQYGDRGMVPVLNRAMQKLSFGEFALPGPE
jgi:integrase